jgi:hypothetical protein
MSRFADEANAAFGEVESEGMPVAYTLSNDPHTGIVREVLSDVQLTEPGFKPVNKIAIVSTVAQFTRPPDDGAREVVQIADGPYAGKWSLEDVGVSVTHFTMTCVAVE